MSVGADGSFIDKFANRRRLLDESPMRLIFGPCVLAWFLLAVHLARCDEKDSPRSSADFQLKGSGPITCVRAVPGRPLVAFGAIDGVIRLWEPVEGSVADELRGGPGPVFQLAVDPKGKWLVSRHIKGDIVIWDLDKKARSSVDSTKLKGAFPFAGAHGDTLLLCGADGRRDKSVHVWSISDGRETQTLEGHKRSICAVAAMASGSRIVSGDLDGEVIVWDVPSGKISHRIPAHVKKDRSVMAVEYLTFLGGTSLFATGSMDDHKVEIWDANDGNRKKTFAVESMCALAASSDGKRLAIGDPDGWVSVWDTESWARVRHFAAHDGSVSGLAFAHDSKLLVTACHPELRSDGEVKAWKLK